MSTITPFLWYDSEALAAAKFYVGIFKNSKILKISHYPAAAPKPQGSVMTVTFRLAGRNFIALNGGPHFKFTEAISLAVHCQTQREVDYYWRKLARGGEEGPCGWLKDRYGLSWQITPVPLLQLLGDPDPAKADRVMRAMLKMKKIDLRRIRQAHAGKAGRR